MDLKTKFADLAAWHGFRLRRDLNFCSGTFMCKTHYRDQRHCEPGETMSQQKFKVIQTITVDADDVQQAAAKATEIIRRSNSARYDVIDPAGYRFHVEATPASA